MINKLLFLDCCGLTFCQTPNEIESKPACLWTAPQRTDEDAPCLWIFAAGLSARPSAWADVRQTGQVTQCSAVPDSLKNYLWILLPELRCAFCGHSWGCGTVIITEDLLVDLRQVLSGQTSTSQKLPRQLRIAGSSLAVSAETLKRRDWSLTPKLAQGPVSYKKIALLLLCLLLILWLLLP